MEEEKTNRSAFCERLKAVRPGLILAGVLLAWTYAVPLLIGLGLAWAVKSAIDGKVSPSPADITSSIISPIVNSASGDLWGVFSGITEGLQEACRSVLNYASSVIITPKI
jgi:hypothetical protein